jgi:hypothetical protein
MKKKLKRLSTVAVARLVRLFDSCCMVAPGITGIIIGLFLSVPMALCLSWLLNILNPFQVPTLQESQILQSTPHGVATSTPSQANVYSTLDLRKAGDEDYPTNPPATSQNLCCPSCVSPLGQWLRNPLIEWHHEPSEGYALELSPYFILPNSQDH